MLVAKLLRTYGDRGTNGEIWIGDDLVCYAIELPWRENVRNISCIPEGTYPLAKRYSKRFGWHILVRDVPMRSAILFHPANNAEKELRGCIAPVSELTGEGKGIRSRVAFEKLKGAIYATLDQGQEVVLVIERKEKE
ncbi:DUF5675 family protein [Olivibacter sitiensis]|uniref:DUF5675 family protein n=1 Tax=Olivibacter sitiensis TaxID=376470 RepID=UPI0004151F85|nr:DUF5675 family protein [Olivibacter sitiensis]